MGEVYVNGLKSDCKMNFYSDYVDADGETEIRIVEERIG